MGQPVIYCRIKRNNLGYWFIQSAYACHLAWSGTHWAPHVDGAGIRYRISMWASELEGQIARENKGVCSC
jgi:hypothetical protein